ncbi:TMV resistance protein N-like [Ipomoea triloba]|uniref:TMV resistance protein N-like n=1 Tax=Ipomoea triloba TaxID=35885 RepID=UPI00125E0AD1|nr:TMV resistance protein N-like [Ipomoea triloba]
MASSSLRSHSKYDVFLSFNGETRRSFADHLYTSLWEAGVATFRDEEEIRKGNDISDELKQAIEGSEISIVVFSKNYAQSRWCLDELVKMVECKQKLGQKILPIFYHVTPSKVRKQTGKFGIALNQHKQRFGEETVNGWKAALTTVGYLDGWHITKDGYESGIIKRITECVLRELNHTYMDVATYPVGIDSRVKDIENLLQSQTNDGVKMIGIFGTGGGGKTTLAKAIYNRYYQSFEGSSFIEDVRSGGRHDGLARLQEKLIWDTLKKKIHEIDNVGRGITLIKRILPSKKVLIVLDNIDSRNQLSSLAGQRDWFGSGSIIIITTRDVRLLSNLRAHEKYEVNMLSLNESLQLLSWYAFDVPGWRDYAEKLKKMPPDKVQEVLKISYDALDDDAQNIFLDIACFFIGHDKNSTIEILKACNFVPGDGIKTLIDRCLLKINIFGKFEMHDSVRDMGREIVRMESPIEPGKRSRLVDPEEIIDVLRGKKGTDAIQGMILNSNMLKDGPFSMEAFEGMKNLRILILNGVSLRGSFEYLSNELRLFRLYNCHLSCIPFNFRCEKLVELDMEGSNIKEFQCNMQLQHLRCLKILKFDYCEQLKKTPNFTGAHTLQKVSFYRCSNLVKVHPSIGSLERLVELNFNSCKKLKVLPSSICKLKLLEILNLSFCVKLWELPTELGKLEQLRELHARGTDISHIPFSLGCLRNLKELDLHDYIKKSRDGVAFFPPSVANSCPFKVIENLTSLVTLYLSGESCYLQSLTFHLCHLSNLKVLYLDGLQNLRVLVELHPSLVYLSVKNCVSLKKIVTVSKLKLELLCFENCESLVDLPKMESLSSLRCLSIKNCNALTIADNYLHEGDFPIALRSLSSSLNGIDLMGSYYPQSLLLSPFHQYSNLKQLSLDDLQNLRSLPQLPPNLERLSAKNSVSLEKIADLSNLKRLEQLDIQNCKSLIELLGLESLESLRYLGIANCSCLKIPSIEKWFKVHPKDDSVYINVEVSVVERGRIYSQFSFMNPSFVIDHSEIDGPNRIDLGVRSKSSVALFSRSNDNDGRSIGGVCRSPWFAEDILYR